MNPNRCSHANTTTEPEGWDNVVEICTDCGLKLRYL